MNAQHAAKKMPYFQRDEGRMPVLGLGTWQCIGESCRNTVKAALELGFRHVDTARMYENEEEVGAGIRDAGINRAEIFLTTKLPMGKLHPQSVKKACEESLQLLGTDYVDLLLIHWPEASMSLPDTLGAMAELKSEGKIHHAGVSNFTVEWMQKAVDSTAMPLFCNQVEYHPYIEQKPVLKFCREHGMAVVAYSPLARGLVATDERLAKIGKKYGKSPAQVALRWLIRQDDIIAVPKGSNETHLRENLDIFDFDLDDEDINTISAFERSRRLINPAWAPKWDT